MHGNCVVRPDQADPETMPEIKSLRALVDVFGAKRAIILLTGTDKIPAGGVA
jgi:hypothetical protein